MHSSVKYALLALQHFHGLCALQSPVLITGSSLILFLNVVFLVVEQKVHAMVAPIESLPFDAYDKSHAALWTATMLQFDQDKEKIEELTKAFIDTSFKKLRSAEGKVTIASSNRLLWPIIE